MASPQTSVPDSATNREPERPQKGEAALRAALDEYGGDLAEGVEYTDELEDVLTTAVLVLASADQDEVDTVTDTMVTLVGAAKGISGDGTVELAENVGDNAEELAEALEMIMQLKRDGHLEELVELAGTFAALDVDDDTVHGLNRLLNAIGEADRESRKGRTPGVLGLLAKLGESNVVAGVDFIIEVLRAQGRRLRGGR